MTRLLNEYEARLLRRAISEAKVGSFSEVDLSTAEVEDIAAEDRDWHHVRLSYPDWRWDGSGYVIIADWTARDVDGHVVELLVLGDEHGRPYELEIRRPDLRPILHLPKVEMWQPVGAHRP